MAWQGNPKNPVPNNIQSSDVKSQENVGLNRADQLRRDTDEQKNFTVRLIDVDTTIKEHLERIQLTIVDEGKKLKVPVFHASPDKWTSIQRDGVMRDYNGMIILPAITFKRTSSDTDTNMQMFNRYLSYTVMKKYSSKNRYTPFNLLIGKNVPVNDVFEVVMPDHMIFTYHFIVWTEFVVQMNEIIERIKFETEDYWGDPKRFKFRTRIDSFSHTIELQVDQDRIVKTEFDLVVNGYLLPDMMTKIGVNQATTRKWMTPKKVVMGIEIVPTGFDFNKLDDNSEKWRGQNYHNLQKDKEPIGAPIDFRPDIVDLTFLENVVPGRPVVPTISGWHLPAPTSPSYPGEPGWQSYDPNYYYLYIATEWKRVPISIFSEGVPPNHTTDPAIDGESLYDGEYFYVHVVGVWKRVPITQFNAYVLF